MTGDNVIALPLPSEHRLVAPSVDFNQCVRCACITSDVAPRYLWHSRIISTNLCLDCNDVVQGPDHCDVLTSNRVKP